MGLVGSVVPTQLQLFDLMQMMHHHLCHLFSASAHAFESLSQKLLHSCNCQPHFFEMTRAKMHSHRQTSLFFFFLLIYSSSMKLSFSNQPQIISDIYKMYILPNLMFSWLGNIKNGKLYREKQFHNVNVLINSVCRKSTSMPKLTFSLHCCYTRMLMIICDNKFSVFI